MGKLFCLMGKSGSGKDTIFKMLIEDAELALKPVVSYTTRPKRDGETDGVEYFFITDERLQQLEGWNKVIEKRVYHTVKGMWTYCTVDDGLIDLSLGDYLVISTLASYNRFREFFGSGAVVPLYINVEDGVRLERLLRREGQQGIPNYEEMCRRFLADSLDFNSEKLETAQIRQRYDNDELNACLRSIKEDMLKSRAT